MGGQLRGCKECHFSGVTSYGRVWRKVLESDARSVGFRMRYGCVVCIDFSFVRALQLNLLLTPIRHPRTLADFSRFAIARYKSASSSFFAETADKMGPVGLPASLPSQWFGCLLACLSVCLPVGMPACLSACLPACQSVCLSACLSGWLPACLPACLPNCQSVCVPACLAQWLPACLSGCLSVCLPKCQTEG